MNSNKVKEMPLERTRKLICELLEVFKISMIIYTTWQPIRILEISNNIEKGTLYNIFINASVEEMKQYIIQSNYKDLVTLQELGFLVNKSTEEIYKYSKINHRLIRIDSLNDLIFIESNLLSVKFKDRIFEIRFLDSPEDISCYSDLKHYDKDTYICVELCEKRNDGSLKNCFCFGIDIVKKCLVEIFSIVYYNQKSTKRSPQEADIIKIQKELYGKKLFD